MFKVNRSHQLFMAVKGGPHHLRYAANIWILRVNCFSASVGCIPNCHSEPKVANLADRCFQAKTNVSKVGNLCGNLKCTRQRNKAC